MRCGVRASCANVTRAHVFNVSPPGQLTLLNRDLPVKVSKLSRNEASDACSVVCMMGLS